MRRNDAVYQSNSFREFWRRLSLRTDYTVVIDENAVVTRATEALNALKIEHYTAEVARFIHEASSRIREIELDELLRGLAYAPSGEEFDISRLEPSVVTYADTVETANRGLYDRVVFDSNFERVFAGSADNDDEVICFLKLPAFYQIPTPIGPYNPDFGVVLRRKRLRDGEETEFHFVVETKGTNELADKKALRESEVYKIKCAMKHFDALGVDAHVNYDAPVKKYSVFKTRAKGVTHA